MYKHMKVNRFLLIITLSLTFLSSPSLAEDTLSKADRAVAEILFEYDGSEEYATYSVNESGFVSITFSRNMPDKLYSEILNRLQNHSAIDGVLAGKGGPVCSLF